MTKTQCVTKMDTLEKQIDDTVYKFSEATIGRLYDARISRFTEKYMVWLNSFNDLIDSANTDEEIFLIFNNVTNELNALDDMDFIEKFAGPINTELLVGLNADEKHEIFCYTIENYQFWTTENLVE